MAEAQERPHEANAVHAIALSMREAIFDIASALAAGDSPASFDLQIIRRMAANAVAAGELVYEGEGSLDLGRRRPWSLERPLWPTIADSAVHLLTRRIYPASAFAPPILRLGQLRTKLLGQSQPEVVRHEHLRQPRQSRAIPGAQGIGGRLTHRGAPSSNRSRQCVARVTE
ncbi:MAG: ABATE domain-containing protein [Thermomicrobiales bacterium]